MSSTVTIADLWQSFRRIVLPELPEDSNQLKVMRAVFYAGATGTFGLMVSLTAESNSPEEANEIFVRMDQEVAEFQCEALAHLPTSVKN